MLIVNLTIKDLLAEIPLYKLNALKIVYKDNNQIIIAEGQAYAVDQFGKEIFSDFIIYDKLKNIIKTKNNSKYRDKKGNKIDAESFLYDLNHKKIIASNNVKYEEKEGNIFYFSEFEYLENSNQGFGKNAKGLMNDKSSFESEYLKIDNNLGTIIINSDQEKISFFGKIKSFFFNKDNKYTTCENINNSLNIKEQCPDWSFSTFETRHDSNKKMFYHDHAVIKIKNIPIFYTPYFSHPDPSVKRKSGLLPASTKNFSNIGRTLKIPYFWAIDENSDLTFTPIFYQDEYNIYLTEYRKQFKNSQVNIDTSFSKGYKNLNKIGDNGQNLNRTDGSRNHLFLNFAGNYENILFKNNDINAQLQRISQKNYLNVNQINTDIVKQDMTSLSNSISINSYENNKHLNITSTIYENLNAENSNSKYQYKIPSITFKDYFKKFNQNFSISNLFEMNNYEGDSKKIIQRNTIQIDSDPKIIKKIGISNIFKFKTSNINHYNENISNTKPNLNNELYATTGLESSLPLVKFKEKTEEILSPKILVKYTTGSLNNTNDQNKILGFGDIYSMDRLDNIDNPETGLSIGYGIDYEINKKNKANYKYMISKFSLGQVLTDVKKNMPESSSLNEKSSNVVGSFNFYLNSALKKEQEILKKEDKNNSKLRDINAGINLNYNFNISNDIDKILKNDIILTYSRNNNSFKGSYYETHEIGNTQYIEAAYQKSFNNNLNFIIGARKNLEAKYTENNFIETNYETDCIKIGLNLSKQFYNNQDLQKTNNLTLFIMLKPFGQPIAPDLSKLLR